MRRILPPAWLAISLVVMAGLHFLVPIARLVPEPWSYAGIALIVGGIALSAVGAGAFRRAGTPVVPFERSTVLVTTGLYRVTRNPMYLGLATALTGTAIAFGTLSPWLPIPVFLWILSTQFIRGEEAFLEEIFGADYVAYKKKVRRWI
ncbi:MAG TPA: isoprenylcysteine carboxylmethyltransferase family protein [Steroidobacteraceae bacterium]|nr:isoprenylcysteine carboxylmethyltransferase family protein [Steroidobacteraceae bacterium]